MGILGENNYWYKIDALIRLSEQMYWHGERSMSCLAAVWSFFLGGGIFSRNRCNMVPTVNCLTSKEKLKVQNSTLTLSRDCRTSSGFEDAFPKLL